MTDYTAVYNIPAIKRGDTMEAPTTGNLCQMVGMTISPTELRTEDKPIIWLAE